MADEWISAHQALELVAGTLTPPEATRAICVYATEGLVSARAKKLVIGSETKGAAEIPAQFWKSLAGEGLTPDWSLGVFGSHIGHIAHPDGVVFCRAYGVEFKRADIEAIIPVELESKSTAQSGIEFGPKPNPTHKGWPAWVSELTDYLHNKGFPSGAGTEQIETLIAKIDQRVRNRGIKVPTRSAVQDVVRAVLELHRTGSREIDD